MTPPFRQADRDPWDLPPAARAALLLPSFLYAGAVWGRNRLYDAGLLPSARLPFPVVAIGNLTVGGSGKTPIASYLAGALLARGVAVAIASRGYGRTGAAPQLVSDGRRLLADARAAGDEPVLLARTHPGAAVAVAADRAAAARLLPDLPRPRALLLDDAFQHRAVRRDVDLLLVDAKAPFGNGRILPLGPLREPVSGLRRADAVVVTRGDGTCPAALREALERHHPNAPIFHASIVPSRLEGVAGESLSLDRLRGRPVFAFSGIAHPARFEADLLGLGAVLAGTRRFRDHHAYGAGDLAEIVTEARAAAAEALVTTAKDRVRLDGPLPAGAPPLLALGIEVSFPSGADLADFVHDRLRRLPGHDGGAPGTQSAA
ncbi:MAG TPA: tetraacyldisaccharide 4'-kinase [Candidatus Polarisedimenticolia bacterium]|nr:tetraacyldisaccharide 4'-kinase [Candidatus Polarisedimenticolia bacterium]